MQELRGKISGTKIKNRRKEKRNREVSRPDKTA
jgi:hypothetical protein